MGVMKSRAARLAAAMAAACLAFALPAVSAAASPAARAVTGYAYGSFAYSPAHHSLLGVGYGSNPAMAENSAEYAGLKRARDAIPVMWWAHGYATFMVGSGTTWAWGTGNTLGAANRNAQRELTVRHGGNGRIVQRGETASPGAVTQADLTGRVCLLVDPTAASHPFKTVGHAAWAFLLNRDIGTWEYGETSGPSKPLWDPRWNGSPAKTWIAKGTWDKLVAKFLSTRPGHYLHYACRSMISGNSWLADVTAKSQKGVPFRIIPPQLGRGNDCLTDAVDVIRAYGLRIRQPDSWTAPNEYFTNDLPGFEDSRQLK